MTVVSKNSRFLYLLAALAIPASGVSAQQQQQQQGQDEGQVWTTVYGERLPDPSEMTAGPQIEGFISARKGDKIQVTGPGGTRTVIAISDATQIKSKGGFLGLDSNKLAKDSLYNGLPVSITTWQWSGGLVANKVDLKSKDLKTAAMIYNGTDQRFAEQTAATEALRSRVGDIDKYNIHGTTNVYFDTGKWKLSPQAEAELCSTAAEANATENALLLVVGYTDSVGDYDYNQELSEKRASKVVNYLQQACGWQPYRMLTPTGMAEADPAASNDTDEGKAQNRRVAVNILVSKSVEGL